MTKVVPGSRILDAPCGTGRHSGWLSKLGFHVTAVDLSAAQIKRAKLENTGPEYICAEMNNLRNIVSLQFDVIINIYSSFGYNTSVGKDQLFLSDAYSLLTEDGHLVMELSDMKRARARLGDHKLPWRRNAHEEIDFDWDTQTLFVRCFEENTERSHVNMRIYSEEQLIFMLFRANFRSVELSRGLFGVEEDEPKTLFVHARK